MDGAWKELKEAGKKNKTKQNKRQKKNNNNE